MGSLKLDGDQRYKTLAEIRARLDLPGDTTALDVGGGTGTLREVLGLPRLTTLDLAGSGQNHIRGSMAQIPVADGSFDLVVQSDALEHIPDNLRAGTLREMSRATRDYLIWICPVHSDLTVEVETDLCETHVDLFAGREMDWLDEHREFGLPRADESIAVLSDGFAEWTTWRSCHLQRYWALKRFELLLEAGTYRPEIEAAVDAWYAESGWKEDYVVPDSVPAYRQVFVGRKKGPLPAGLANSPSGVGTLDMWKAMVPVLSVVLDASEGDALDGKAQAHLGRIAEILSAERAQPAAPSFLARMLGGNK